MNLDIEGTKHEKVVIIVLAYVMGFTAGFICFGVGGPKFIHRAETGVPTQAATMTTNEVAPTGEAMQTPEPVPAEEIAVASPTNTTSNETAATYTDGKLQIAIGTNTFLLSMKVNDLDNVDTSEFKNQGSHVAIPAYLVSPDNKYVYFCEQKTTEDICNSFIFDVSANAITYVSVDGKKLTTTAATAKAATWTTAGLSIDGKTSIEAGNPSVLSTN